MWSFFLRFSSILSKSELVNLVRKLIDLGYFDLSVAYTYGKEYKEQSIEDIEADLPEDDIGVVFVKGQDGEHLKPEHKLYGVLIDIDDTSVKWFDCNQAIYSISLRNDQISFSLDGPSDLGMANEALKLTNFSNFIKDVNEITGDKLVGEAAEEEFY